MSEQTKLLSKVSDLKAQIRHLEDVISAAEDVILEQAEDMKRLDALLLDAWETIAHMGEMQANETEEG